MAIQTIKEPKAPKAPKPDIDDGLAKALRTQQAVDMPYITSKSQLQTQITGAEGRAAKAKQEQDEMLVAGEKTGTEKEAQAVRGAQEAYQGKLQAEPLPAFIPTKDSVQDIAGLFSLISVIGAVAGKGNAQMALGNMNAMLEGYQKGRGDLYKKEAAEFDKNFKAMIKKHEEFRKEMEDAVKLAPYDKQQAMIDAKLAAVKAGSAIVNAQLDKGYLMDAYKTVDELQKGVDKAKESYEKQKAKEVEIALKRELLQTRMAQAGERRDEKALQSIGPALRNIAEQYPDGTAVSLIGASPDDKKRVQGAYRAVEESEKVADFVARNPNAVGALAVAKNFLKVDAIKSLQSEDEATVAASKAAVIDQQLDAGVQKGEISRDDAEAAKVLQKKLFALALADVQGSGQRGSVYLDRQFQNLYDQASRDTTLVKIIRERADENNRNLKTYKLNVERHNNPEQFPLLESRTTEDFIKERKPKSGVPENVEKALKGKPEASGVKSGGKTYRIYGGVVKEVQE